MNPRKRNNSKKLLHIGRVRDPPDSGSLRCSQSPPLTWLLHFSERKREREKAILKGKKGGQLSLYISNFLFPSSPLALRQSGATLSNPINLHRPFDGSTLTMSLEHIKSEPQTGGPLVINMSQNLNRWKVTSGVLIRLIYLHRMSSKEKNLCSLIGGVKGPPLNCGMNTLFPFSRILRCICKFEICLALRALQYTMSLLTLVNLVLYGGDLTGGKLPGSHATAMDPSLAPFIIYSIISRKKLLN